MNDYAPVGAHSAGILKRIETRLRSVLNVPDDACFIAEDPRNVYPPTMPDKAYIVTSEGASYNFDGDQTRELLIETAYFNVTCFNRLAALDESARAVSLTSVYETNLFEMKRRALLALVGWRLKLPDRPDIEIASTMKATKAGRPEFLSTEDGAIHAAFLPVTFSVSYTLDLCDKDFDA